MKLRASFYSALFILTCPLFLTSCPEDSKKSLPGSQWILVTFNGDTVNYVEYIEFTSDQVNFYEDSESCWDFFYDTYEIDGQTLVLNGGDFSVEFELDGNHLHIIEAEAEWVYHAANFNPDDFNICQAVKRLPKWNSSK